MALSGNIPDKSICATYSGQGGYVGLMRKSRSVSLSPFGVMLNIYAKSAGILKQDLARAAGIADTATMTRCTMAIGSHKKAYAPPLSALVAWADCLSLKGDDRKRFILFGILSRTDCKTARGIWKEFYDQEYPF